MIREGEGVAAQVLVKLGADLSRVRQQVIQLLSGYQGPQGGKEAAGAATGSTSAAAGQAEGSGQGSLVLDQFGRNLTQLAREKKLDPVIGRTRELERVMQVLSRRTKNNPVLIGEPGVGKTAIVEGLAQKIVANDVPDTLKAKQLISSYYGRPAQFSYWDGCSTGGKQGLTEAQRFPEDFNGIVAGAPANYMIHLHAAQTAIAQALDRTPAAACRREVPAIQAAAVAACTRSGLVDDVIDDPRQCSFDPVWRQSRRRADMPDARAVDTVRTPTARRPEDPRRDVSAAAARIRSALGHVGRPADSVSDADLSIRHLQESEVGLPQLQRRDRC